MLVRVRTSAGRWFNSWFSMALVFVLAAVSAGVGLGRSMTQQSNPDPVAAIETKRAVLQDSAWLSESYWRQRRVRKLRSRRNSGGDQFGANPFDTGKLRQGRSYSPFGSNYRTVCVRLCDGYYFPISASTSQSRFRADEQACQSKCAGGARLYYYSNAGGSPETMRDRRGRAYADLKTAFLYRTSYDKSCKCRPDPWSEEAKQRHAMYATKGWKKEARRVARLEKRRARRATRSRSNQPQPSIIPWDNSPNNQSSGFASALPPASFVQNLPQPTGRRVRGQRYSEVRMGLGRPITVKRQPSRQRNYRRPRKKTWRSRAFGNEE